MVNGIYSFLIQSLPCISMNFCCRFSLETEKQRTDELKNQMKDSKSKNFNQVRISFKNCVLYNGLHT